MFTPNPPPLDSTDSCTYQCVCVCYHAPKCKQLASVARKRPVARNLDLRKRPLKLSICDTSQIGHSHFVFVQSDTVRVRRKWRQKLHEGAERERERETLSLSQMPKTKFKLLELTEHGCQKWSKQQKTSSRKDFETPFHLVFSWQTPIDNR